MKKISEYYVIYQEIINYVFIEINNADSASRDIQGLVDQNKMMNYKFKTVDMTMIS